MLKLRIKFDLIEKLLDKPRKYLKFIFIELREVCWLNALHSIYR